MVGSYSLKRKELISTPFIWNKDEGIIIMISEIIPLFMFSFFLNLVVIVTSSEKFIFLIFRFILEKNQTLFFEVEFYKQ